MYLLYNYHEIKINLDKDRTSVGDLLDLGYNFNELEDCLGSMGGSFGVHWSVGVYVGHWIFFGWGWGVCLGSLWSVGDTLKVVW